MRFYHLNIPFLGVLGVILHYLTNKLNKKIYFIV